MRDNRTKNLENIRVTIPNAKVNETMQLEERFQNQTIRPIVKFQNNLIIEIFKNYTKKYKSVFYTLSIEKRVEYIEKAFLKDTKLKHILKGVVIGLFTINEYNVYANNTAALNKRIISIIKDRILSQLQLFEK